MWLILNYQTKYDMTKKCLTPLSGQFHLCCSFLIFCVLYAAGGGLMTTIINVSSTHPLEHLKCLISAKAGNYVRSLRTSFLANQNTNLFKYR